MNPIENLTSDILSFTLSERGKFKTCLWAAMVLLVSGFGALVVCKSIFASGILFLVFCAALWYMHLLKIRMNEIAHTEASKFFLRAIQLSVDQFISQEDHQFDSKAFMTTLTHEVSLQRIAWFTWKGVQFDWMLHFNGTNIPGLRKEQTSIKYNFQVVGIVDQSCLFDIPIDQIGVVFNYEKAWYFSTKEIRIDSSTRAIYLYSDQGII
jgi:hypothetical protein